MEVERRATTARRLPRAERREQILAAATRAFARAGFAGTGLDAIAGEAGVTPVVLYRHFDSKAALYRAALDRACARLEARVGRDDFDDSTVPALVAAAAEDPDGFRLLFRHAAREPEFRSVVDALSATSVEVARQNLARMIPDGPWRAWAATVVPAVTIEAIIGWLDAGQPDPDRAAELVQAAITGVIQAARQASP